MRPGERPYIVTVEVSGVHATSAEEAANSVCDSLDADLWGWQPRIIRALPQNPTVSDAINRGEAGAL